MNKIRIGVFGAGRGVDVAKNFLTLGCDVVALCDFRADRLKEGKEKLGVNLQLFDDFDKFLDVGLDAVIIANFFHEHAPYAIKCFQRNIHVFSECISNGTMAEGVQLYQAFKKSKSIYMLAENYPQMIFNREIKRVCDGGTLGKIVYAEGEYNHPADPNDTSFMHAYNYYADHWRNYLPRAYYVTHSLGPIMWATGATPKRVTAFSAFAPNLDDVPTARQVGDTASIITTLNDDGSIFRITGCAAFGGHHNAYRVCGTNGQIENIRGMGDKIMLRYNGWSKPEGKEEINCYDPEWNDPDADTIKNSGHGGSDYLTARNFIDCIKKGVQPEHPFDIKSAIAMSSCAILGHRSVLNGGQPFDLPDFDKEEDIALYKDDYSSPFISTDGVAPSIPCCSHPDFKPTENQLKRYQQALDNLNKK